MCDEKPIWGTFALITTAILGAMGLAIAAMATNPTWWTSWQSPILLGAAAAAAGTAAGLVFAVQKAMNDYFNCMNKGATRHCVNERDSADRYLVAIGAAIGTAATIALYNLIFTVWPILGLIPMVAFYAALSAQLVLVPVAGAALKAMVDCLKKHNLGTQTMPLPSASGRIDYDVFTCPMNRISCSDGDLRRAGRSSTPIFSVSRSFVILIASATSTTVQAVAAEVEDGFGNRVALKAGDISAPGTHSISNPAAHAARCRDLVSHGLRVEPGNHTWKISLDATFADGSRDALTVTVSVAN